MEAEVKIKYTDGTEETKKYAGQEKYDQNNTVQFKWLEAQSSKQGAVKTLIRDALNEKSRAANAVRY